MYYYIQVICCLPSVSSGRCLFLLWKVWFSLHSNGGCNLLSEISKTTWNSCHFCQGAGSLPVLLSHCSVRSWYALLWGFRNHLAVQGAQLVSEMDELWPKGTILIDMSVLLYVPKSKHDAYPGCPLRIRRALGRETLWMWNKCQVGCVLGRGVCKLGFVPSAVTNKELLEMVWLLKEDSLAKFRCLVSELAIWIWQQVGFLSFILLNGQNTDVESQLWFKIEVLLWFYGSLKMKCTQFLRSACFPLIPTTSVAVLQCLIPCSKCCFQRGSFLHLGILPFAI